MAGSLHVRVRRDANEQAVLAQVTNKLAHLIPPRYLFLFLLSFFIFFGWLIFDTVDQFSSVDARETCVDPCVVAAVLLCRYEASLCWQEVPGQHTYQEPTHVARVSDAAPYVYWASPLVP